MGQIRNRLYILKWLYISGYSKYQHCILNLPPGLQSLNYLLPGLLSKVVDPTLYIILSNNYNPFIDSISYKLCFGPHFQFSPSRILTPQTLLFHQNHQSIDATTISKCLTHPLQGACLINICWVNDLSEYITSHQSSKSSQEPHCLRSACLNHSLVRTFTFLLPSPQKKHACLVCSP